MKYITQYKTIAASLMAGLSVLGLASVALAQENQNRGGAEAFFSSTAPNMQVQIGGNGNAVLRGTVDAVGATSLTVKSWGGSWTVNVSSSTVVTPHATTTTNKNDLSLVKVGDVVGVQGTVSTSSAWTIDAKSVHDGITPVVPSVTHQNNGKGMNFSGKADTENPGKAENHGKGNKGGMMGGTIGRPNASYKIFEGVASNVGATSFTLTASNGTVYTVNVSSTTKLSDKSFKPVSGLVSVQANDKVRVAGTLSGTAITALVVRDSSLPR